ncbi:MAG: hypothetical protein HZB67_05895 [Candidatus Aenigmarchaeota archaeon]|nr:hypothetical protein [Candidatus Aenigmarchaeota archaeon]
MELLKEIYLDTNMIHGWFRNFMASTKNSQLLKIPSVLEFLIGKDLALFTTTLTKIEIFRYIRSEWGLDEKFCNEVWDTFIKSFNITSIEVEQVELGELLNLVSKVSTRKKTLVNLMHLQLAKKNGLWFLTGEENLKERYAEYYDKVLTYQNLRKLFG